MANTFFSELFCFVLIEWIIVIQLNELSLNGLLFLVKNGIIKNWISLKEHAFWETQLFNVFSI